MKQNYEDELLQLNQETFDAEDKKPIRGQSWDQFLRATLADKFTLRRANAAVPFQDREEMIAWADNPRIVSNVRVRCCETLGVVTCRVTLRGGDGKPHHYQNIKVFERKDEGWQCVYWQVTETPDQ